MTSSSMCFICTVGPFSFACASLTVAVFAEAPANTARAIMSVASTRTTTLRPVAMVFIVSYLLFVLTTLFTYASNIALAEEDGNRKIVLGAYGRLSRFGGQGSSNNPLSRGAFREDYTPEAQFPRTPLLGSSVNRGNPPPTLSRRVLK